MERSTDLFQTLYSELEDYEQYGILMKLDGTPASPMQIATAHIAREDTMYMRDYVLGLDGKLQELSFHNIKNAQ